MRKTIFKLSYYKWLIFGVTSFGTFMSTLTTSIVNVALPPITAVFQTDLATVQWIVTAYLLFITGLLPVAGRLGDLWGRSRVYSLGFLGFTLGCIFCSLSSTIEQLIISRLVQATGASALMANSPAIVTTAFPVTQRGKVLGMVATAVALGQISGPSIGGFLVSSFNWQSIFYVSIILGILGSIASALILPADQNCPLAAGEFKAKQKDETKSHQPSEHLATYIDYQGAILFFVGMISFLLAINNGVKWGYKPALALIFFSGAVFAAFIRQEKKAYFPIIDLSIFRIRTFSTGIILAMLSFVAISANTILLPFFLHDVKQMPLTDIGFLMLVFPLLSAVITPFSGALSDKTGPGLLTSAGLGLMAIGLYYTARLDADSLVIQIIAGQAIMGLGNSLFQPPNNSSVIGAATAEKLGTAGGISALARNAGMVIGTAMAAAIFEYKRLSAQSVLSSVAMSPDISSFLNAYHDAMAVAAIAAAGGFLISLGRMNYPKKVS